MKNMILYCLYLRKITSVGGYKVIRFVGTPFCRSLSALSAGIFTAGDRNLRAETSEHGNILRFCKAKLQLFSRCEVEMNKHPERTNFSENIVLYAKSDADKSTVRFAEENLKINAVYEPFTVPSDDFYLQADADGLALVEKGHILRGDFTKLLPRLTLNNLNHELLVKASKLKGITGILTAVDATAGLGEDAFLLAGAGFQVHLYERNPVIAALLYDALRRGSENPNLAPVIDRMQFHMEDSITALTQLTSAPDIIVLDPMFPSRQKSGLIKKKFQLLQQLEQPCSEEQALLHAAISCGPRRIVIKRPLKGPYLAGLKPSYSLKGKSIRYDCIVMPQRRETA